MAPEEPQSFSDLAFALFFRLRARANAAENGADAAAASAGEVAELAEPIELLSHVVLCTTWPERFREIE